MKNNDPSVRAERLNEIKLILLKGRTQRYPRYLHSRDALETVKDEVKSICVCGAGGGWAELAMALEFPHIHFTLTDIVSKGYPNYHYVMDRAWRWGVDNMTFSAWNVLQPTFRRFDMIASTEMLEHIKDDRIAARNMALAATKYLYCLVPYATKKQQNDLEMQKRVWDYCEHFTPGYDEDQLKSMFPNPVFIRGAYWSDAGTKARADIKDITDAELVERKDEFFQLFETDLKDNPPSNCFGIKILHKVGG